MNQTCPSCGAPSGGSRFCPECGVALNADCPGCGNTLPAGAKFCNDCGRPVSATAPVPARSLARSQALPWGVTALAVVALAVVAFTRSGGGGETPAASEPAPFSGPVAPAPGAAPAGDARSVDINNMTPREAADRLFNRVMENVSRGDTAQARAFLPMAIAAYGRVEQLDLDGRYHVAALHLVGADPAAARAQADTVLASRPAHLLGLFVAGEAERTRGNTAEAKSFFQRFLDGYDAEMATQLPEYRDHSQSLPAMRDEARKAVGS